MKTIDPAKTDRKQTIINLSMAVVAGQAGCLTLLVVVIALLAGLWIDNLFDTRPLFTLILVIASIPISLVLMFLVVQTAITKIKTQVEKTEHERSEEEVQFGEQRNEDT